jgi:hypothetical protein
MKFPELQISWIILERRCNVTYCSLCRRFESIPSLGPKALLEIPYINMVLHTRHGIYRINNLILNLHNLNYETLQFNFCHN